MSSVNCRETIYDAMTIDLSEPTEEMVEYARLNLGETADARACAVQNLTDMIYETGTVTPHRMDEEFLVRFLRARHFNVEKAHELMIKYYDFKKNNPHFVQGVSPWEKAITFIKTNEVLSTLPNRDQKGRRVLVIKVLPWDTSKCTTDDILKACLMVLECALLEPRTQIYGGVVIFDLRDLSLKHTWQVTPAVANKILQLMGIGFPILVHEVHIVNQPHLYDIIYAMFKPLLTAKMRAMLHFHGKDYESFHQFIDPKCLPEEYGGAHPAVNFSGYMDNIIKHPSIIKELESLGYINVRGDESA